MFQCQQADPFLLPFAEVEYVRDLSKKHWMWKVVDTTKKSIEETAWEIIHHVFAGQHEEYN